MRIVTALTRIVTSYWAEWPRFLVTVLRVQRMEQIEGVSIEPCTNSKFIQPYRVKYKQVSSEQLQEQQTIHQVVALSPLPVHVHRMATRSYGIVLKCMTGEFHQ